MECGAGKAAHCEMDRAVEAIQVLYRDAISFSTASLSGSKRRRIPVAHRSCA